MLPIDFDIPGVDPIVDDAIFEWLIRRVPFGARLTALVDACTSGTICDLPVLYGRKAGLPRQAAIGGGCPPRHARPYRAAGETVLYSGSADLQRAADITICDERGSTSFGIMTHSFVEAVLEIAKRQSRDSNTRDCSFGELLQLTRELVRKHVERNMPKDAELQEPQLSSSHRFDIFNTPFSL